MALHVEPVSTTKFKPARPSISPLVTTKKSETNSKGTAVAPSYSDWPRAGRANRKMLPRPSTTDSVERCMTRTSNRSGGFGHGRVGPQQFQCTGHHLGLLTSSPANALMGCRLGSEITAEVHPFYARGARMREFAEGSKLKFGVFELDVPAGELRKAGTRVRLQDQPRRVLTVLLDRPGKLITREELRQELWPSDTFVDFEHGLSVAVNKLRQALADDPDHPRFIETIPKRGYRFIAPVIEVGTVRSEAPKPARMSIAQYAIPILGALVILTTASYLYW